MAKKKGNNNAKEQPKELPIEEPKDAPKLEGLDAKPPAKEDTPPPSVAPPPPTTPKRHMIDEMKRKQLADLTKWLTEEVIGFNADPTEMEQYAIKFLERGLHSVAMLEELCTPADIARWTWMREFHKRRFITWFNKLDKVNVGGDERLLALSEWLQKEIIMYDPDKLEMGLYAQRFVDMGYHSVKMIEALCTPGEVESWVWMKSVHKRLFLANAKLQKSIQSS